jgi:peptidoglycan/xylan/chitin deacetylase (PgdA/CDA1 family)
MVVQYAYRPNPPPTRRTRTDADQEWLPDLPLTGRPAIRWPGGARVAVWLCPSFLTYEFTPPDDPWTNAWARTAPPDVLGYCRQEYGLRVGFWRILKLFDRYGLKATTVINTEALELWPDITDAVVERGWDFLGHGKSNTRFIYDYSEDEERRYYREMIETVERRTGVRMKGMGGPGPQAGTESTPDLMAEAGFLYSGDWYMDDQPAPLKVRKGRLISLPYPLELNDAGAFANAEADQFATAARLQFDRLYAEGADSGRVLAIAIHPHLFGQPQRIRYLEEIFEYITSFSDVWHATGAEIAEFYLANHYEEAARLAGIAEGASR